MCSIGGIEQTVEEAEEEEKARWQRGVRCGPRIAVLTVQMLGVYLTQKGTWWMSAVNLMGLACSEAQLLKTTCVITKEIFELL